MFNTGNIVILAVVAIAIVFVLVRGSSASGQTSDELRVLVRDQGALLVDVRTPQEFATGHMDGAINVPVQTINDLTRIATDTNQPIVLYCRSGARASSAMSTLRSLGYTQVYNLGTRQNW